MAPGCLAALPPWQPGVRDRPSEVARAASGASGQRAAGEGRTTSASTPCWAAQPERRSPSCLLVKRREMGLDAALLLGFASGLAKVHPPTLRHGDFEESGPTQRSPCNTSFEDDTGGYAETPAGRQRSIAPPPRSAPTQARAPFRWPHRAGPSIFADRAGHVLPVPLGCTIHSGPARRPQASDVSIGRAHRWPRSAGAPELTH